MYINIYIYIYILIKDRFNPINKLSCQPVGCQATSHALRDIECMRTFIYNLPFIGYDTFILFFSRETSE